MVMKAEGSAAFPLGVEGLDRLLGPIRPPHLLVVAGSPGSGKTTLASTICYGNAMEGKSCLYVSFYEEKEKLFDRMLKLGLNLAEAEARGLLRYLRLPVGASVDSVAEMISTAIAEGGYGVVVVDSINVLLEPVEKDFERRAWLLNFFYNLPSVVRGLGVLIAELPYGSERLEVEGLEFVADTVLLLKHKIEDGFLSRYVEIRKSRGVPVTLVELPFSITEGRGVEVWVPPVIEYPTEGREEVRLPCETLRRAWGHLHRGHVVNMVFPGEVDYRDSLLVVLALALENDMRKVLVVSYRYPPQPILDSLRYRLRALGVGNDVADEVVSRFVKVVSINPFSFSISQLVMRENAIIESENPDVVVFHGVEVPRAGVPLRRHIRELYNQMNYLKQRGLLVVRMSAYTDRRTYSLESRIGEALIRFYYDKSGGSTVRYKAFAYRRNALPVLLSCDDLAKCVEESADVVRRFSERLRLGSA